MPVYPEQCENCEHIKDSMEYAKVKQIFKNLKIVFKENKLYVTSLDFDIELDLEDLLSDFWEDYKDMLEAEDEEEDEMYPPFK